MKDIRNAIENGKFGEFAAGFGKDVVDEVEEG